MSVKKSHADLSQELMSLSFNPSDVHLLRKLPLGRLLIFECSGGKQFIDFIPHAIQRDRLFFVPPGHYHFIPSNSINGDFISIDIDNSILTPSYKIILYALKYRRNRSYTTRNLDVDSIFSKLKQYGSIDGKVLFQMLYQWVVKSPAFIRFFPANLPLRIFKYIKAADHFLEQLENHIPGTRSLEMLAEELSIQTYTLRRICKHVFGISPAVIINYHRLQLALFIMLTEPEINISILAKMLGFGDSSNFSRFIKEYTNLMPTEIKNNHLGMF